MRESRRVFPFVTGRDCVFLAIQIVLKVWVQGNVPSSSHWDAQRTLSRNWSDMFVETLSGLGLQDLDSSGMSEQGHQGGELVVWEQFETHMKEPRHHTK